jgi:hypothetical protein
MFNCPHKKCEHFEVRRVDHENCYIQRGSEDSGVRGSFELSSADHFYAIERALMANILLVPSFFFARFSGSDGDTGSSSSCSSNKENVPLDNLEEEQKFDASIVKRLSKIIEALPSLEY